MKAISLLSVTLLLACGATAIGGNTTFDSFQESKKQLLQIYANHRSTFYCNAPFNQKKNVLPSDKYTPKRADRRSQHIEWEHIVPAQAFGQSFPEWRDGHPECVDSKKRKFKGRSCASKVNIVYRYMQADMYNLVPAIGEINGLRSNYSYAMIPGEKRIFGNCDMEIEDRKAEPAPSIRGDIARTYLYMESAYPGRGVISGKNKKLFEAWNNTDPVDTWECQRAKMIEQIQKNENPFVKEPCQAKGLWK